MAGLRKAAHKAGAAHFGSGWVWLSARGETLSVTTTHDGDTLAGTESIPLLVCDLWEHAYYLDFQNDRGSYLSGFWEGLANWSFAEAQFTAANGDEAVEKSHSESPDLILMDVVMPGTSGFQATRTINRDESTAHIPVILCTSKSQDTDRIWGLRQGAKDYVVKPVNARELLNKIRAIG